MENNKTIITEGYVITLFNNFKKFYHAYIKINNIKIDKTIIIDFLFQLLNLEYNNHAHNHFCMFPTILKLRLGEKCKDNEREILKIYKTYFKEHVGNQFIDFLKRHGALGIYKDILNEQLNDTLLSRILFSEPQYYIDSFIWEETKQGFDYWNDLHNRWMDLIDKESYNTQFTPEYREQIMKIITKYIKLYS